MYAYPFPDLVADCNPGPKTHADLMALCASAAAKLSPPMGIHVNFGAALSKALKLLEGANYLTPAGVAPNGNTMYTATAAQASAAGINLAGICVT